MSRRDFLPDDISPDAAARALRWALDEATDPAQTGIDWIVSDIAPGIAGSEAFFAGASDLDALRHAKEVFKSLRMTGRSARERRLAARFYAATIAAALVHHGTRITTQSDRAVRTALERLSQDTTVPASIRSLAADALALVPPV